MKKVKRVVCFFLILSTSACNKSSNNEFRLTQDLKSDLNFLLAEGFYKGIIMNGMILSEEIKLLSQRMKDSLKGKETWFIDYINKNPDTLLYHPNFGINESEFNKIQAYKKNAPLKSTSTESLMIRGNKDEIRFEGSGFLSVLSETRIDLKNKTAIFKGKMLKLSDIITVNDTLNPIRSSFSGYKFSFKEKRDSIQVNYNLSVCWLEKDKLPYLVLSSKENSKNRILENYTLPIILTRLK